MEKKKQHLNLKCQIQNPIIFHVYELSIENAETGAELKDQLWQYSQATSDQD